MRGDHRVGCRPGLIEKPVPGTAMAVIASAREENVRNFLRENPDIARNIETQIRATLIPVRRRCR